jgi:hypothetical protein
VLENSVGGVPLLVHGDVPTSEAAALRSGSCLNFIYLVAPFGDGYGRGQTHRS